MDTPEIYLDRLIVKVHNDMVIIVTGRLHKRSTQECVRVSVQTETDNNRDDTIPQPMNRIWLIPLSWLVVLMSMSWWRKLATIGPKHKVKTHPWSAVLEDKYTEYFVERDSYSGSRSKIVCNDCIQSNFFRAVRTNHGWYEGWSLPAKQHNYLTANPTHRPCLFPRLLVILWLRKTVSQTHFGCCSIYRTVLLSMVCKF